MAIAESARVKKLVVKILKRFLNANKRIISLSKGPFSYL